MLKIIFFLVFHFCNASFRVLSSGRDVATHQPHYSGAKLLNSFLAGQDTVTICARAFTYQFTQEGYIAPAHVLMTFDRQFLFLSGQMTEKNPFLKHRAARTIWRNGDIALNNFGTLLQVDWRPGVWNSACFLLSISRQLNQVWFNGKIIKTDDDISSFQKAVDENITLSVMGEPHDDGTFHYSMFGAMTDVNIWNRSLSGAEVEQWSRCELGAGGNLLDWNTAQWEAVGLQEEELDTKKICQKSEEALVQVYAGERGAGVNTGAGAGTT